MEWYPSYTYKTFISQVILHVTFNKCNAVVMTKLLI